MAERVLVTAVGNDYESTIIEAQLKMKNMLGADAQVMRNEAQCEEMRDWYVSDVDAQMSRGEQMVQANVYFQLAGTDL